MAIFSASLVVILLTFIETSLLPHFKIFGVVPFITLSFIVALSVRYRGSFHLILAFVVGLYFDAISSGIPGLFTSIFVFSVILGKFMFFRETGYDSKQSYLWLLGISTTLIYFINEGYVFTKSGFDMWQDYLTIFILGVVTTMIAGIIILNISDKYFDWLNKKSDEKYR